MSAPYRRLARRTLGDDAHPLDEEVDGLQVIAVGDHRLVLPPGSRHFRAVVTCSDCGAEFVHHSQPVLSREHLKGLSSWCERCSSNRCREQSGASGSTDPGWLDPGPPPA